MGNILEFKDLEKIRVAEPFRSDKVANEYLTSDNNLIRLYHYMLDERKKSSFLGLGDEDIAFPKDIYYYLDEKHIIGYLKPLLKGVDFNQGFYKREDIENLLKAYTKGIETISKYPNIMMYELYKESMVYNTLESKFEFITTDSWRLEKDSLSKNLKQFNAELMYALIYGNLNELGNLQNNFPFLENQSLKKLYEMFKNHEYTDSMFGEFLTELVDYTEHKKGKVKKIGELKISKNN